MTQRGNRRVRSAGRQISTAGNAELAVVAAPVASAQGLERAKGGAPQFTEEQLRRIDGIVAKANPQAASRLAPRMASYRTCWWTSASPTMAPRTGKAFRKLAAEEVDHAEMARRFRKIASSGNPLKPTLYADNMMAELYLALRQPLKRGDPIMVPSARAHIAASLAKHSVADIQSAARHLAIYHQSQVRRGPPRKHDLDTLLDELGRHLRDHHWLHQTSALPEPFQSGPCLVSSATQFWNRTARHRSALLRRFLVAGSEFKDARESEAPSASRERPSGVSGQGKSKSPPRLSSP